MKSYEEMSDAELEALAYGEKELDSLSDAELEARAYGEQPNIEPPQNGPVTVQTPEYPTIADIGHLGGQAILGLGDEVAGVAGALGYLSGGGSFSEVNQIYKQAKDSELEAYKKADKDFPISSTAVSIGSMVATAPYNAVKMGALTGAGMSEGTDRIGGALLGGTLGKAGQKVGDYIAQAGPAIQQKIKHLRLNEMLEGFGAKGNQTKTAIIKGLQQSNQDPFRFMEDIFSLKIGDEPLYTMGQELSETFQKSKTLQDQFNNAINDITHTVDLDAGGTINANPTELSLRLTPLLAKFSASSSMKAKDQAKIVAGRLEFLSNQSSLSLRDIHKFTRAIAGDIDWKQKELLDQNHTLNEMLNVSREYLGDSIEYASSDPLMKQTFQTINKKFSNLLTFDEVLGKQHAEFYVKMGNIDEYGNIVKNSLNMKFGDAAAQILQAVGISTAAKNATLKIVSAAQESAPRYGKYASRLIQAASRSPEAFERALAVGESVIDLSEAPLERTFADLELKKSQIYNLIEDEDPGLANQFLDAMEYKDSDKVGPLLNDLSRVPKYRGLIVPGIGWEGKVTNETEKNLVKQQIKEASISTIEKMRQTEALEKDGSIPQPKVENPIRKLVMQKPRNNGRKQESY